MADDRYNEKQVASILREAAAAQARALSNGGGDVDLTAEEIAAMASEVGIEPRFVLEAANKLESTKPKKRYLWGAPNVETITRTFDGHMDDQTWDDLLSGLQKTLSSVGTVTVRPGKRSWKSGNEMMMAEFTATEQDGKTKARLVVNYSGVIWFTWAFGFAIMFVVTMLTLKWARHGVIPFDSWIFAPLIIGAIFGVVRAFVGMLVNDTRAKAQSLVGGLEDSLPGVSHQLPAAVQDPLPERLREKA
jgi:hypothetical protein